MVVMVPSNRAHLHILVHSLALCSTATPPTHQLLLEVAANAREECGGSEARAAPPAARQLVRPEQHEAEEARRHRVRRVAQFDHHMRADEQQRRVDHRVHDVLGEQRLLVHLRAVFSQHILHDPTATKRSSITSSLSSTQQEMQKHS